MPLVRSGPKSGNSLFKSGRNTFVTYVLLGILFAITAICGQLGISAGRLLFIGGGLAIGVYAYRTGGLPLHAEVVIAMFAFSPLLRRLIDLHVGYEPSGTMLSAPLAALVCALPELRLLLSAPARVTRMLMPYGIALLCILYGWSVSAFTGNMLISSIVAAKLLLSRWYTVCAW